MKIAFYIGKDNGWFGSLIRFVTRSNVSHCAIVFSDNQTTFQALGKGVYYGHVKNNVQKNPEN